MATDSVTVCPGVIVAGFEVIVTTGSAPPEWQPLQPCDAMPFLCACAASEASRTTRPAAIPSRSGRVKIDHTIRGGRPDGAKRLKYSGCPGLKGGRRGGRVALETRGDLVGEQE